MNSPAARIAGLLFLVLAGGCAGLPRAPQTSPPTAATQGAPSAVQPPASTPGQATPAPVEPANAVAKQPAAAPAVEPPRSAPKAPVSTASVSSSKTAAGVAATTPGKAQAVVPAAAAPAASTPKTASSASPAAPAATAPAAPPPLDLASLERRLRETRAIGVFTKISLKNQVDDLLDKFRAYYQGRVKTTLTELRQPFDLLLLKVLSLLQDTDPPLAHAIVASREALWGILSDPKKFEESNLMAGETS